MVIGKFTQEDWDTLSMLKRHKTPGSREERLYTYILGLYKGGGDESLNSSVSAA